MKQFIKISIESRKIAEIFFFLFVFSLFFPIRYVFTSSSTFQTGVYSDFTSISLYLSDILLVFTVFWLILAVNWSWPKISVLNGSISGKKKLKLWVFIFVLWLILSSIWHFKAFSSLNVFIFVKFLELLVSYGTISILFRETSIKQRFLKLFAVLGTVQACLALGQFYLQHPLGVYKLGEQQIFTWNQGIAKLIVSGTTYIRGYGTFPHPNPLSAYLVVTILILVYLFLQTGTLRMKVAYSLMLILSILGLVTTFSRASFLALGFGLVLFFGYLLIKRAPKANFVPLGTILISLIVATFIFKQFLITRTTVSDSAALQRVFYAKVGWQIINENPITGVGVGESVFHMQQYSPVKLLPWQIQPIHNYFELSAAELGIPGALILIWIFLSHLKTISYLSSAVRSPEVGRTKEDKMKANLSAYSLLLVCLLLVILVLMQFDHYFYTLQQTQLLLWLILGAIAAEIKTPSLSKVGEGRV